MDLKAATSTYFGVSIFMSVVSLVGLLTLYTFDPPVIIQYEQVLELSISENEAILDHNANEWEDIESEERHATLSKVLPKVSIHLISIFMNFFVILAVFPGVTSAVYSINTDPNRPRIQKELFTPLHFVCYNIFDFLGKSSSIFKFGRMNSRSLFIGCMLRLAFIPLFLSCNVQYFKDSIPTPRLFPVLFNDQVFFILVALFGYTSGFINSVAFVEAPNALGRSQNLVGAFAMVGDLMGIALALGLAVGSVFSFAVRWMMCGCNPFVS
jgi:solute carrier family 29 (equilibrative nucleoside transporter), member 1/2/3